MKFRIVVPVVIFFAVSVFHLSAAAQDVPPPASSAGGRTGVKPEHNFELQPGEDPQNRLLIPFAKHIAGDQKEFWTAPARFRVQDLKWIVPFVGISAGFIASDSWWSKQVNPNHMQTSLHVSDYTTYGLAALSGGAFLLGQVSHDDHMSESGLLAGEAAISATGVTYLFKEISQRQRPLEGNGNGNFFVGGASFTSEHSAIAWSIASVMAHEYPGWLSQLAAYGAASTVTLTRVTARQHFPSDVIVGSALGWYFGRQVYWAHHDPELGGSAWGSLVPEPSGEKERNPDNMASPYVLLDSWIYPAFERLIALGYVHSARLNMRPWTRMECARLLEEADEQLTSEDASLAEADAIYRELTEEFKDERARLDGASNLGVKLDSLYTRSTEISGTPLSDGFHTGQTIINDYGRPYWTGFNNVSGFTTWTLAGPFALFLNGEYQHSPAVPSESPQTLREEAAADTVPFLNPNPVPQLDRLRLLNATASFQVSNVQFTFGQQSLWLGPTEAGSMIFSDNAEPLPMFRIDSVTPYRIPFLSDLLGPMRSEFFLARLSGQLWSFSNGPGLPSQPWLHGTKVSFAPTENFQFGMGFTAQFGGTGNPFTWGNFFRTFYAHTPTNGADPAKRLSQFDFSYRIPGVRKWLTFYTDSMVIDEYSPLGSSRPQINPGLYFPQLPKLHKLQLRLEGITTDLNIPPHFGTGAVYTDVRYRSGYTNNGVLMGNWIGRRGRGEQGWLSYGLTPRSQIQLGYRHNNVDKTFLGGDLQDLDLRADLMLRHDLSLSGYVQYETWNFPVLSPRANTDITGSIELTFWPSWSKNRH